MSPAGTKSTRTKASRTTAKKRTRAKRKIDVGRETANQAATSEPELLLEWFRLLARRRGAWLQHLWMNESSIDGRTIVTHAELAGILADQDSPEAEAEWTRNQEPVRSWIKEAEHIKRELDSLDGSRLKRLVRVFGLQDEEKDLLQLCAALAFDPELTRVCAYLQDHSGRTYLTEDLATRLLEKGRSSVWVGDMNVFRWKLIQQREVGPGEPNALVCDVHIRNWLLGRDSIDEHLMSIARPFAGKEMNLPEWPTTEIASWIDRSLSKANAPRLRVIVVAPQGAGKLSFAAAITQQLSMPLLVMNADNLDEANWPSVFMRAQRQAFLDTAALAWTGEQVARRHWPITQSPFPLQFVLCEPDVAPVSIPQVVDRFVYLPMPEASTRERLWRESVPTAAKWSAKERRTLAEQHRVWPGDIERASHLNATTPESASLIVRERARARFGNLAQILECPFRPDDLVVSAGVRQLLDAIVFEAHERVAFWQQPEPRRLFPQGRGLIALFSGPSGTGKTMAAQVIAAELGQDLCRVNVAQLVSKWVGETPKNVEAVIRVASESNVVLFFDEADALFARRSPEIRDAQDKFANTDTAFLLQAIETYPGVAILATNLRSNIDSAFQRRLRYLVEFPKPDPVMQRTLWTKFVRGLTGDESDALTPAVELLSKVGEATGAQIKYAVLGGVFAARAEKKPLDARHLLIGFDRELARDGRTLAPMERERILKESIAK